MPAEIGCVHPLREQLPWYINGTLEGAVAAEVTAHLDVCADCSADLRELASFCAAIDRHGVPVIDGHAERRMADRRRFRIAAALAAGLLLPSLLGIYWGTLGFPTGAGLPGVVGDRQPVEPPSPSPSLGFAVALDLTTGGSRDARDLPTLLLPARATAVTISFRPPPDESAGTRLELRDPSGATLARLDAAPLSDRSGRAICIVPATLLQQDGDHALVILGMQSGTLAEYAYPFRVSRP